MPFSLLPSRRRAVQALLLASAMPRALWAAPLRAHADEAGAGLAEVIDGPQRSAANRARDAARHPYDTLRFFGLAPWQTVIEIAPGGGWYTEILAPYLRDHGRLYAAWDAGDGPQNAAARARFAARLAGDPQVFGKVVLGTMPGAGQGFAGIAPRGGADSVLTFRNVHNWIERGELDAMLRAFHGVLKPGGVLGVEEHRAAPGTPLSRVIATGYVPEAFLIARARAAGFELAGTSEVNANPRDTRDHPNGVWSLPPTLRGGEQDRARLQAIGESDRMTLRFIKLPA